METPLFLKGQRINCPGGPGEVVEVIGDKLVKLDKGATDEVKPGLTLKHFTILTASGAWKKPVTCSKACRELA